MTDKPIRVPEIPHDADGYTAALAYAQAGLYVIPIRQGTKHPGSILGKDWPSGSTRSAGDIFCLWREDWPKAGVGIHAGRSGLVVIDVDKPDLLPDVLRQAIQRRKPPFQVTRELPAGLDIEVALDMANLRGHALFRVPDGRMFGNSLGKLPKGWGDIRGANGFIVTAPTRHEEPDGRYRWLRTGRVPYLPDEVASLLPDGGDHESVATDEQVKAFRVAHATGSGRRAMSLIDNAVKRFEAGVKAGGGRHTGAVEVAVWMAREAAAGMYPAGVAFNELWRVFDQAVSADRGGRNASASLRVEFDGIVAWAVGQALAAGPERIAEVREKLDPRYEQTALALTGTSEPDDPEQIRQPAGGPPDEPAWMRDEPTGDGAVSKPGVVVEATVEQAGEGDEQPTSTEGLDFWQRRKVLDHIWRYAVARYASPWAVLGVVLARVVAATGPQVQLPATVGGYGSLNLMVALVAPSGGGKGAADSVGTEVVEIHPNDSGVTTGFERHSLGSGEGLAHMFMRRPKPTKAEPDPAPYQYNVATLVVVSEIDTFGALSSRQGSTLAGQLRQAAMGEQLGFFYVDRDKRMQVPAHTYRLCVVAGVQPRRARVLLDDVDGGTPQRFLWLPATNPDAPPRGELPECPQPLLWLAPDWPVADGNGRTVIGLPEVAVERTLDMREQHIRGEGNPLDGHANLTRLKVAAALAILDGHTEVSDEDWELSGMVMAKSDSMRDAITVELKAEARERNTAQGIVEAERQMTTTDHVDAKSKARTSANVLRKLSAAEGDGWIAANALEHMLTHNLRKYFDDVMNGLVESGQVTAQAIEYRGQPGTRYVLTSRVPKAPPAG